MAPTFTALRPKKLKPRVDFDERLFRTHIFTNGLRVLWELAARCPCQRRMAVQEIDEFTSEKRPDCPACNGTGVIYHSPQEITAQFTSAERNYERFAPWGENMPGMARFTLLPEHLPTILDRYTLLDAVITYTETRIRKAVVEALRYPIVTRSLTLGQVGDPTEPDPTGVGVVYARRADSEGVLLGNELVAGTDFDVISGEIDWAKGDALDTAPEKGSPYSVQYFCSPRYVVKNFPHAVRDTQVLRKLPSAVAKQLVVAADAWLDFLGE